VDEEDAAALLLSLPDGDGRAVGSGGGVPEGSMEHELPSAGQAAGQDKQKERPKPARDASAAAKAILEKYLKRSRNT